MQNFLDYNDEFNLAKCNVVIYLTKLLTFIKKKSIFRLLKKKNEQLSLFIQYIIEQWAQLKKLK